MKKSLIALSVASAAASSAFAQLDLNVATDTGTSLYASEIDVSGTGIEVVAAENVINNLGFTVTDAAPRFVRYDLTNGGNFVGDPDLAFSNLGTGGAIAPNFILSDGGDKKSFVLFEINAANAVPIPNDARVELRFGAVAMPPGMSENLGLDGTSEVSYTLFEFGAGGGNGELASAGPKTLATFAPSIIVGVTGTVDGAPGRAVEAPKDIEVADDSLNFEGGGVDTAIGSIYVADAVPLPTLADGSAAGVAAILTSHTVEITGDFSFAKSVGLYIDSGAALSTTCASSGLVAGTINSAKTMATFAPSPVGEVGDLSKDGVEAAATICIKATGTDIINEGSYAGVYKPVAPTGFTVADVPFPLGTLGNTGQTVELNLTLTPSNRGGTFRNLIRVSNTSSTEGRVFFRMINDAGESSPTVTLADVTGGSDTVLAQGSSQQININAIYDAVVAEDPTFEFGDAPSNKLRTIVTGEFGSMDVQTYTVSTDNTTFATF